MGVVVGWDGGKIPDLGRTRFWVQMQVTLLVMD